MPRHSLKINRKFRVPARVCRRTGRRGEGDVAGIGEEGGGVCSIGGRRCKEGEGIGREEIESVHWVANVMTE